MAHGLVCVWSPGHGAPPRWAGGQLHWRVRVLTPVPHVTEHWSQSRHAPHLPSTATTQPDLFNKRMYITKIKLNSTKQINTTHPTTTTSQRKKVGGVAYSG